MLKKVSKSSARAKGATFAIVASKYNGRYVDAMLKAAQRELKQAGATVEVVRVPGAFEIPAVAAKLAARDMQHAARPAAWVSFSRVRPVMRTTSVGA
jgi:6,7-dimethyl-8-ribityllumazine synthase